MTILLRGEALRWRDGTEGPDLTIRTGERLLVIGGNAERRAALRELFGGRWPEALEDGRLFWRNRPAAKLSPRRHRAWKRSVVSLGTNPYTSLLPRTTPFALLREIGGRKASVERFSELAHLPPSALRWPVASLSGVMRARLLYALALSRSPALLLIGDLAPFFAAEVWEALLRSWLEESPPHLAVVVLLPRPLPALEAMRRISLDF